jgi:hypothetical protein
MNVDGLLLFIDDVVDIYSLREEIIAVAADRAIRLAGSREQRRRISLFLVSSYPCPMLTA